MHSVRFHSHRQSFNLSSHQPHHHHLFPINCPSYISPSFPYTLHQMASLIHVCNTLQQFPNQLLFADPACPLPSCLAWLLNNAYVCPFLRLFGVSPYDLASQLPDHPPVPDDPSACFFMVPLPSWLPTRFWTCSLFRHSLFKTCGCPKASPNPLPLEYIIQLWFTLYWDFIKRNFQ